MGNKDIAAAKYIGDRINLKTTIGIILGSGLGGLAEEIEGQQILPYSSIPYFPETTVQGHAGRLIAGNISGVNVLAMQGRFHYYEGHPMADIIFPIKVMRYLGIKTLIVSNAAGGVNRSFAPGDLMVIKDHINLMGKSPLVGVYDPSIGPRFPDLSRPYDPSLIELAKACGKAMEISLKEGIYVSFTGPNYETPAEIRMVEKIGGDAVGMSTVPEVIAARWCGMKVLGFSCITNFAAGITDCPLNHEEVIQTADIIREKFSGLIKMVISKMERG